MTLENEKRVFGTRYDLIKSIVIMSGRNALETPMLGQIITKDEQLHLLSKIVSNNKHPWIKQYDLKVSSFENSIAQEQRKKSLRKKRLTKVIKKSLWKRLSVKQKIKFIIKKSAYYFVFYIFLIGVMFLFFAIGLGGLW